jgi:hypothetical protein
LTTPIKQILDNRSNVVIEEVITFLSRPTDDQYKHKQSVEHIAEGEGPDTQGPVDTRIDDTQPRFEPANILNSDLPPENNPWKYSYESVRPS